MEQNNNLPLGERIIHILRDFIAVLKLLGFLLVILALGFLVYNKVPQGQDMFRAMGGEESFHYWFFIFVNLWSFTVWYSARVMLRETTMQFDIYSDVHTKDRARKRTASLIEWLPRLLGLLPYIFVIEAFASFDKHYVNIIAYAVAGIIYFIIVVYRRRIFKNYFLKGEQSTYNFAPKEKNTPHGIGKKVTLAVIFGVIAAMILFSIRPFSIGVARSLSPAAIVALSLATWTAFGMYVYYWSFRSRLPLYVFIALVIAGLSVFNSNHRIRTKTETETSSLIASRLTLNEYLHSWIKSHRSDTGDIPLYIAAAEGGGIRAMLWTGELLQQIDSVDKNFYSHLFAITSASGGSVGSVFFNAFKQFHPSANSSEISQFRNSLHEDFLSPITAAFVYPDFLARFSPVPICVFDRARWLEDSWTETYSKLVRENGLDSGFLSVFRLGDHSTCPAIILNTTCVQNGKRALISNIKLDKSFQTDIDVFGFTERDIPLKTAASMSARFPYITPQATIVQADSPKKSFDLVDGGYADNSGLLTAMQVYLAVQEMKSHSESLDSAESSVLRRIKPKIIYLRNSGIPKDPKGTEFLAEELTPLNAFMSAYDAGSNLADSTVMRTLQVLQNPNGYEEISLRWYPGVNDSIQYPLGWYISDSSASSITNKLSEVRWKP